MVAFRRKDPEPVQLLEDLGVSAQWIQVVILDGRGELLDGILVYDFVDSDQGCTKDAARKFASRGVALIKKGLKKTKSMEDLERHWLARPNVKRRFTSLAEGLEAAGAWPRLSRICDRFKSSPRLSETMRVELRFRGFLARRSDMRKLRDAAGRRWCRSGLKLLAEFPRHPKARDVAHWLYNRESQGTFDQPRKTGQLIARLERRVKRSTDARALERHIAQLRKMRIEQIQSLTKSLADCDSGDSEGVVWQRGIFAAFLGDARQTIECLDRPEFNTRPYVKEWLVEARAKLGRGRRGGNSRKA